VSAAHDEFLRAEFENLSPELALVDPELAERARQFLSGPGVGDRMLALRQKTRQVAADGSVVADADVDEAREFAEPGEDVLSLAPGSGVADREPGEQPSIGEAEEPASEERTTPAAAGLLRSLDPLDSHSAEPLFPATAEVHEFGAVNEDEADEDEGPTAVPIPRVLALTSIPDDADEPEAGEEQHGLGHALRGDDRPPVDLGLRVVREPDDDTTLAALRRISDFAEVDELPPPSSRRHRIVWLFALASTTTALLTVTLLAVNLRFGT
jgi:hypothetical protein